MSESTPLTAAERADLEALEHRFPTLTRLLDERDALAAQLAEYRETHPYCSNLRNMAAHLEAQLLEARGIARRLMQAIERLGATKLVGVVWADDPDLHEVQKVVWDFDALHWPDPKEE